MSGPSGADAARRRGKDAVQAVKRALASGIADVLRKDPERLSQAVETGLVSREWLERPGEGPVSEATPVEVMERWLERSVEQKPSVLATLGLNAVQVLSWRGEEGEDGQTARLTVVFTDLEGFTAFTAANGDEAASRLLTEHLQAAGPVVRSRGGRLVKRLGDGLLLTFPAPEAAVMACIELVDAASPLRLRAGVHVGDVVVRRDDVVGHVVNVAARVTESAKGGQVLVSDDVRAAVGELHGVRFGRARRRRFHGVDEAVLVSAAERV
ncbi:MAG: putative adenylyl cyclase class-3/4/guanylyl cyclase [Acidimicrobiales bacterium]|nr:putative adenylyl cyclase class-3/4/guanylyl cyclase [Acidimicrobiales bacterium]